MIVKENKSQIFIKLMANEQKEKEPESLFAIDDLFGRRSTLPPNDFNIDDIDHVSVLDDSEPMLCINPFEIELTPNKYVCNYEIQIENDDVFKVTSRIIGIKGMNVKRILYESCNPNDNTTKLRLRGRGSGYLEGYFRAGMLLFI
jgi:hypothetical protein